MKKNLLFIAKALTVVAAVAFVSCNKDNKPSRGSYDDDDEEQYEGIVKIDGDFSDWNGIDCATASLPSDGMTASTAIRTFKLTGDAMYFYI
ncbi:MAG: hypothetical protein K2O58_09155, partial [Bacteroidales bacterium]|nr:hypothetical protein [Bacteroidales bacterium]